MTGSGGALEYWARSKMGDRLSDTDYVAAIDDSGGVEPLVKWGGKFVEGDHKLTVLAIIFIKTNHLPEFEERWIRLRQEIQNYLGCSELPPVHLRLMYGRTLPKSYRGKPNPYVQYRAPFQKIVDWATKGVRIVAQFNARRQVLGTFIMLKPRQLAYEPLGRYFDEPQFKAEMQFLKEHSVGVRKNMALRYLNRMASPLLPLLTDGILTLDEQMRLVGRKTVALKIDPFAEAHGLDVRSVLSAVNQVSELKQITSIEVMADSDNYPLSQAADLIGFANFRFHMSRLGYMAKDPFIGAILRNLSPKHLPTPNLNQEVKKRYNKHYPNAQYATTVPIHYAVARGAIEAVDSQFAERYLVTVEELKERAKEFVKYRRAEGLSILRDPTVCKHLVPSSTNGDDPG